MATQVGVVSQVIGEVYVQASDGSRRLLSEGDRVYLNEQIITADSGAVRVALSNGGEATLGRGDSVTLDSGLLNLARGGGESTAPAATPTDSAAVQSDVEALQAAIAAGADPTALAEATAAGPTAAGAPGAPGGAGSGHSFVLLDATGDRVDPQIGYPTGPIGFAIDTLDADPDPDNSIPSVSTPDLNLDGDVVDESALSNGTGGGTLTTSGAFVIDTGRETLALLEVQDAGGNWVAITAPGTVVNGVYGELSVNPDGSWIYTLTSNSILHSDNSTTDGDGDRGAADQVFDPFQVRVTDGSGDVSPEATLTIAVNDDGPLPVENEEGGINEAVFEDALMQPGAPHEGNDDAFQQASVSGSAGALFSLVNFGADGPGSFSLLTDVSELESQGLTSAGQALSYSVVGDTLTASVSGTDAGSYDVFSLTVGADGSYSFTLLGPLDHPTQDGNDGEWLPGFGIDFSSILNATDGDGDSLPDGFLAGSFTINVQDDVPTLAGGEEQGPSDDQQFSDLDSVTLRPQVSGVVHEDALSSSSPMTAPFEGNNEDSDGLGEDLDPAQTVTAVGTAGALHVLVNFGADGPGDFSLSQNVQSLLAQTLSSGGQALSYRFDGDTLVGYVGAEQGDDALDSVRLLVAEPAGYDVFTLSVGADGSYTFTLLAQLDHPQANGDDSEQLPVYGIDFSGLLQATDGDGDPLLGGFPAGSFSIQVEDDVPVVGLNPEAAQPDLTVDESPLPSAGDGVASQTLSADFVQGLFTSPSFGADGPAADSEERGAVRYSLNLTGEDVESGLYAIDPNDHSTSDVDGDGYGQGEAIVLNQSANTITGSAGEVNYFSIAIDPNSGEVTFTLLNNIWHANSSDPDDVQALVLSDPSVLQLVQTATDGDGDSASVAVTLGNGVFKFEDDGPLPVENEEGGINEAVFEDALMQPGAPHEGNDDAFQQASVSGSAGALFSLVNFGADGPGSFSLLTDVSELESQGLTSAGQALSYSVVGDTLTASVSGTDAGSYDVFSLTVGADGSYSFTLLGPLDHPTQDGNDGEWLPGFGIDFSSILNATDGDGDSLPDGFLAGSFTINVQDDVPTLAGGEEQGPSDDQQFSDLDSVTLRPQVSGVVHEDALSSSSPMTAPFEGNNEDSDGLGEDLDPAQTVTAVGTAGALHVLVNFGADGPGDFSLSQNVQSLLAQTLSSGGQALSYRFDGDTLVGYVGAEQGDDALDSVRLLVAEPAGYDVFTLSVGADGSYTFTLLAQLDHPQANGDDSEQLPVYGIDFSGLLQATDGDGDPLLGGFPAGSFSIQVEDDVPVVGLNPEAAQPDLTVDESPLPSAGDGVASQTLSADFVQGLFTSPSFGADGPAADSEERGAVRYSLNLTGEDVESGLYAIDPNDHSTSDVDGDGYGQGEAIVLNQSANTITGSAGEVNYFSIAIDPNSGEVTFTLLNNIWHANSSDPDDVQALVLSDPSVLQLVQTATDGDGDSDSVAVTLGNGVFKFEDDGPHANLFLKPFGLGSTTHDESAGAQNILTSFFRPQDWDNDTFGALPAFADVANPGTDLDPAGFAYNVFPVVLSIGSSFGADNEGAMRELTLQIDAGNGTDSGLKTTAGDSINLFVEGDLLVGRVSGGDYDGEAAFAVAIGQNGHLSMVQYISLQHPNTSSHDEPVSLSGKVSALLTITDGDGDVDTASVQIGHAIRFEDDGPTADIALTQEGGAVTHDETFWVQRSDDDVFRPLPEFAGVVNAGSDIVFSRFAKSAAALVTSAGSSYGADDEGATTVLSLSIVGGDGVDSGLKTTAGDSIKLYAEGDLIVGRVDGGNYDGQAAFAVAISESGHISMAQYISLHHPDTTRDDEPVSLAGKLNAVVTVTDGDDDTATDSVAIGQAVRFEDDGPSAYIHKTGHSVNIDESAGLQGDDVANLASVFASVTNVSSDMLAYAQENSPVVHAHVSTGEDEEGASWSYGLKVVGDGSTTLQTTDGDAIKLTEEGGLVVGRTASGEAVFAVHIDDNGKLSVAQYESLKHPNPNNHDEEVNLGQWLQATVTVTDGDGDKTTDTVTIGHQVRFDDDGPSAGNTYAADELDDEGLSGGISGGDGDVAGQATTVSGTLNFAAGADGLKSIELSGPTQLGQETVTSLWDSGSNTLTISSAARGTIMTVALTNPATGAYLVTLVKPVLHDEGNAENDAHVHVGYKVTDGDDDHAHGTLHINVDDDTPTVSASDLDSNAYVTYLGTNAGFHNSYGYYIKAADGTPLEGKILWADVKDQSAGDTASLNGLDPNEVGFFIIPDGGRNHGSLANDTAVTFQFVAGKWQAVAGGVPLVGEDGAHVLFSDANLNPGGSHLQDTAAPGNQNWEDLTNRSDYDFNDVSTNVTWGLPLQVDETYFDVDASADFSGAFTVQSGADGLRSMSYSLAVAAAGTDSGLVDTASGESIYLYMDGNDIVGRVGSGGTADAGGAVAWRVSVDSSGSVTLDQISAIVHPTGDPDELTTLASGLIKLGGTAVDNDGDGDTAWLDLGAALGFKDDGPTVTSNGVVRLDDDALGGNPGGTGDGPDGVNTTGTLNHDFGEDGAGSLQWLDSGAPAGFTYEVAGNDLLVKQGGETVLTLSLNPSTGEYSVTQNAAIDHRAGGNENDQSFNVSYLVTDKDGDQINGRLSINVDDDTPVAKDNHACMDETHLGPVSLTLVLDTSGSMQWAISDGNGGTTSRLAIAQDALTNLINSYVGLGVDLHIRVIDFDGNAELLIETSNPADAITAIGDVLLNGGSTRYEPPLNMAQTELQGDLLNPALAGYQHKVYFLSDGQPNSGAEAPAGWQAFVDSQGIDVVAVGVEISGGTAELDKVGNSGDTTLLVNDALDLSAELQSTLPQPVTGNLLTDAPADMPGADAPLTLVQLSYDQDPSAAVDMVTVAITQGDWVTLTTPLGGTLRVHSDGSYQYMAPSDVPANTEEVFTYRVVDSDGDSSEAELHLCVDNVDRPVYVRGLDADGAEHSVNENDLPLGSDNSKESTEVSGQFAVSAPDGLQHLAINGVDVVVAGVVVAVLPSIPSAQGALSITAVDLSTGIVSYTYALQSAGDHPAGNGTNSQLEQFTVTATDSDGDSDSAVLDINIIDDVPTARNNSASMAADDDTQSGNVLNNDTQGADQPASVAFTSTTGTYGSLTSTDAGGGWTYDLNNASAAVQMLGEGESLQEHFDYTLTDHDGDSDTATLSITVHGVDDPVEFFDLTPKANGGDTVVDEADLPTGSNAVGGLESNTGDFRIAAPDGIAKLTVEGTDISLAALQNSGSTPIQIITDLGNHLTITGYLGDAQGGTVSYRYDLLDNETHSAGAGRNSLYDDIDLTLTDDDALNPDSQSATLSVRIIDDIPEPQDVKHTVSEPSALNTNLLVVLDMSGSMDNDPNVAVFSSRLAVAKAAINQLVDAYDGLGDVMVRLVTFNSGADSTPSNSAEAWLSASDAKALITAFADNAGSGLTNYDAALLTAQSAFAAPGKIAGAQNVAYFLSDGKPTSSSTWPGVAGSGGNGINGAEETAWETFLTDNDIKSYALGMGNGATQSNLDPVAFNGINGSEMNGLVVTDLAQLASTLTGTVSSSVLDGNLFTDGVLPNGFGADGPAALPVVSVEHNGVLYNTSSPAYDAGTTTLTVATAAGGMFTVNFTTGAYSYSAPSNVDSLTDETFTYTVMDADGDTASADWVVCVKDAVPIAYDNKAYVEQSGTSTSGDFELGLAGWQTIGHVQDNGYNSSLVISGTRSALIRTDGDEVSAADVATFLGVDVAALSAALNSYNSHSSDVVVEGAAIKTQIHAQGGDELSFKWNFVTSEGRSQAEDDAGFVLISNGSQQIIHVLSSADDNLNGASGTGYSRQNGVQTHSITLPSGWVAGLITVAFAALDDLTSSGGSDSKSALTIDDVSLNGQIIGPNMVSGNVLLDANNDPLSLDPYGATDQLLDGARLYKVAHGSHGEELMDADGVSFTTDLGALFSLGADGAWSYTAPSGVTGIAQEVFTYTVIDQNGDMDSATLTVAIAENGALMPQTLVGSSGIDSLIGDANDDLLIGAGGDDTLTGGAGGDSFIWQAGDTGTTLVTDFSAAQGDALDFADFLVGETTGTLDSYLNFTFGVNTVVHASSTGDLAGNEDQTVTLQNVDLSSLYASNDINTVLQGMLDDGTLRVDTV
ncbi:retention module-containing protein [Atopomonas sediminilitoris]|uniref:retention module-containing protein n=1 Tax=Atopomonas sediminilitoris TaxID=2919919 RepID=UPI001F4E636F|nr:retention module-containing protein [Atopomonas sediminilitoris]MCJ8168817.1 retention module-containing protein [Atopomonas sediminilitoris]